MRKHQVNILLLKVIKRFAFRQNTPNQFVGYFDAAFLIRGAGIAIENKTAKLIVFILFDGDRIAELTATAAAIVLGVSPNAVKYGLAGFEGAGRRFDFKGKFQGADLYDDYAHHPSELRALLDAVDTLNYQRTIVVFQPHTYSRTAKLFNDFVEQLRRPTIVYLAEIYAAREKNTIGISSADLAAQIPGAKFYPTFAEIERELRRIARPGDIILTVGAGDVFRIGEHLLQQSDSEN